MSFFSTFIIVILVLADDFSGAAEMAGIAHSLGCSAEIQTILKRSSHSDVVAIDTHTRALRESDAVATLEKMMPLIRSFNASWIFKKVDSVLRGHVLAESATLMRGLDVPNGVLISANPSKNRIIRDGEYFIDGTPLHQTVFANDPAFPATTSNVMELLGSSDKVEALRCPVGVGLEEQSGLLVPDVISPADVCDWSNLLSFKSLAVGGVDFFSCLIKQRQRLSATQHFTRKEYDAKTRLLVCGSLAAMDSGRLDQCRKQGWSVHLLPESWMTGLSTHLEEAWSDQVLNELQRSRRCMVGINSNHVNSVSDPSHPARRLIEAVQILCRKRTIDQVLVEGGETAYLLVCAFGEDQFKVVHSSKEGIPEILPFGMPSTRIVPKPGSYPWPDEFLEP